MKKISLAVFASGSGTNAENIIQYFASHSSIQIKLVLCNKAFAGVIEKAQNLNTRVYLCTNQDIEQKDHVKTVLSQFAIDGIILAGFLRKIPTELINSYPDRIINIHPSLLPKYGGKGMYGMNVHKEVILNKEKQSGITIHLVDELYDNGKILYQEKVNIEETDTPEIVQQKIHELEMKNYPKIIEQFFTSK